MATQYTNLQSREHIIKASKEFSLEKTITCGQTFRYEIRNGTYIYPFKNSILELNQIDNKSIKVGVAGENISIQEIKELLGLEHNIDDINRNILEKAPNLSHIIDEANGIRVMKNPPYEVAISFIFSIQTSIPTIRKRLNMLAEMAGKSIEHKGEIYYAFPTSTELRKLANKDLGLLHLGFRERFLKGFIEQYDEEFFEQLSNKSFDQKRDALLRIKGVGEKVAQCILLFGFGELSAFPVDVWIERAMKELFSVSKNARKVTEEGRRIFGESAGYAQQYMYYFIRSFGHC
ncbi:MAG: DNA-3-methyladenine glycosylase 2 [Caldisericaceae bacterium]